ncbi:DUF1800 domain-containing protein [Baekduia soli]|uniref:DUF1800 domain-containing protein n=1 Tax=Baekduia soli TaxID=496014 RepID=A0A5B8U669_9ACTN|nr:DUF1800 domain-containing protein [Baekduia soli]QEC48520.1 DUF1800 domain-containing protein [Baekduia soli]
MPSGPTTPARAAARTTKKKKKKKTVKAVTKTCRTVTKKVGGRRRKVKVCTPVKKKPVARTPAARAPAGTFSATLPAVVPPAPPITAPADPPAPSPAPVTAQVVPVTRGQMERLLWRTGFGPTPGQAARLAGQDVTAAILAITRPTGAARLVGPEPHDDNGNALAPADVWGHDHCAWMDRMVRSDQPIVERMALVWHDWFATSNDGVGQTQLMLDQIQLFRDKGLGSFDDLFRSVTANPAMLIWLNGTSNTRWNPNENYAREMMELFSLGADRGAYTETDIRQMARALTGWRNDWSAELGSHNFRYDPTWHDMGSKTIFGQTGAFDWTDAVRLCVEHPLHASFFCTKLWSYFVPTAPDAATLASLQGIYLSGGRQIRPVVEAILQHPQFLDGPEMVLSPVVYVTGLLRAIGRGIDTTAWSWLAQYNGQRLFYPPNVAGWDDTRWLDTSTVRGRWLTVTYVLSKQAVDPWAPAGYDVAEDAATALAAATAALGDPPLSDATRQVLADFAATSLPAGLSSWQRGPYRAMRQNALRTLIATAPDHNVC